MLQKEFLRCKMGEVGGSLHVPHTLLYVLQSEGFIDPRFPYKDLHLDKSLCSLKLVPRIWCLLLCGIIIDLGFGPWDSDPRSTLLFPEMSPATTFSLTDCARPQLSLPRR